MRRVDASFLRHYKYTSLWKQNVSSSWWLNQPSSPNIGPSPPLLYHYHYDIPAHNDDEDTPSTLTSWHILLLRPPTQAAAAASCQDTITQPSNNHPPNKIHYNICDIGWWCRGKHDQTKDTIRPFRANRDDDDAASLFACLSCCAEVEWMEWMVGGMQQ